MNSHILKNKQNGNLYLAGNYTERASTIAPLDDSLIFKNESTGNAVAYIDVNGELVTKGRIFIAEDPDRTDSQGN